MPTTSLPIVTFDVVHHIGTLDIGDKQPNSLEGNGLSVSQHPDDWEHIARLGGRPWWQLTKPGARFVNVHELDDTMWDNIHQWGAANNLCERAQVWQTTHYDDELETDMVATHRTRQAAETEHIDGPITTIDTWVGLEQLATMSVWTAPIDVCCVDDLLAAVYFPIVYSVDGLWWNDLHDPARYSAPRGVIPLGTLARWDATCIR